MSMRPRLLVGLGLLAAVLAGLGLWRFAFHAAPPPQALVQEALPEGFVAIVPPADVRALGIQDTEGRRVTFGDLAGKPVLLNVWAKWCAPCVIELPKLDKLQAKLGKDLLTVATVAVDEPDPEKVRNFLANRGWLNLPPYLDPKNELAGFFKIRSIPVSILIDRSGFAVARADAPVDWYSDLAFALLQNTILRP